MRQRSFRRLWCRLVWDEVRRTEDKETMKNSSGERVCWCRQSTTSHQPTKNIDKPNADRKLTAREMGFFRSIRWNPIWILDAMGRMAS